MKIKMSDVLLSILALVAIIVANNDVDVVHSGGVADGYPYPYPYVVSITRIYPYPNPTTGLQVEYEVRFSENVWGVDLSDFDLTTSGLTGSSLQKIYPIWQARNYGVVANTGTGTGTIRLDVSDDDSIFNAYAVPLGTLGLNNGDYTSGAEYTMIPPDNDEFSASTAISALSYQDEIPTAHATSAGDDPSVDACNLGQGQVTVWYTYTPDTDTAISIDTYDADYDTFIAVWEKPLTELVLVACNDDANGTEQSALAFQATAGTIYYIEIGQP